jgi:hypothetical protein
MLLIAVGLRDRQSTELVIHVYYMQRELPNLDMNMRIDDVSVGRKSVCDTSPRDLYVCWP